eukprot:TRINITY_DN41629_c0_g1_i1.p1 TRINITY_DN41629_c0_g1~~TRINITY_DN41629_c0_g1_i1.p1  ORF type:complete len:521 (+),score=126.14 TRINITY_DN41629_c0_g1_i1:219-1781(+)
MAPKAAKAKAKAGAGPSKDSAKAKAKAEPKTKPSPGSPAAGSGTAAVRQAKLDAEVDPKVAEAETLLRDCLEETQIALVDGRVLDIAVGQAKLLASVSPELLKSAEVRLEEYKVFQAELKQKAEELRARKDEAIEKHDAENGKFSDAVDARKKLKQQVEQLFDAVGDSELDKVKAYVKQNVMPAPSDDDYAPAPLPLDVEDHDGNTPLSEAACYGEAEIVEYLIEMGAHLNTRNCQGRTPLWRATYNGHEEVVKMLLEAGADPTIENNDGEPPGKYGTAATKALIAGWDKTSQLREKLTPLQRLGQPWPHLLLDAVQAGDVQSTQGVLSSIAGGSDSDSKNILRSIVNFEDMVDALWMACTLGHKELCQMLLDAGADVNSFSQTGLTCLMICCRKGHTGIVKELLSRGAKTFLRSEQGQLASDYAREFGDGHGLHDLVVEHCRKIEDWSTLEEEARQSTGNKACGMEAAEDVIDRRKNIQASNAATAALRALPASELREGSDRYKELLEQRALADVLGMG